ncbi:ABC transporter permease [Ramlibacter sp. G-1-2-2]|uniref:ABC transporter permease n=1 Tax=Ramlibacter agri TaxID=2728837 RepID=A0A848H508_9BURK|nr:ABC transporter permease [Ramlibacter agri]
MMLRTLANIFHLGVKELWGLWRDPAMLVLIVFMFGFSVYSGARSMPQSLNRAPIAIVDEDASPLSARIAAAFFPPQFVGPAMIGLGQVDPGMDAGIYTFVLVIPANFQRDVLAGRGPALQLNVDATRMTQAFNGSGAIQQIVQGEVSAFVQRAQRTTAAPVELALRARFNQTLDQGWFGAMTQLINNITMVSILLCGAALIREREHGTIEHLLAMPVTPTEIMLSKVWSMGLVVLVAVAASLQFVVKGLVGVPVEGSMGLFLLVTALHLFATTAMGIFMATMTRSMPQFALLLILILLPLQMLSGGTTPRESMPQLLQDIMLVAPTTHFTIAGQAILFRGAGLALVWPQLLALLLIAAVFFGVALRRFRRTISQMA